jgi:hypothetical protein
MQPLCKYPSTQEIAKISAFLLKLNLRYDIVLLNLIVVNLDATFSVTIIPQTI